MAAVQLPQNKPLSEQVCVLIENEIVNGTYKVGDKLPTENELAEIYKVSRTVIREATKILKEKGRLESFVGKGTYVIDQTERGIGSSFNAMVRMNPVNSFGYLLEVREIIEPEMAGLAAIKATADQIAEMSKSIDLMDQSIEGKAPREAFLDADATFHALLAEATGNPLISMLVKPLGELIREQQQFMAYEVVGGPNISQKLHKLIFESIKSHDPESARVHMREHIRLIHQFIHDK